jgi:hypothetical protein
MINFIRFHMSEVIVGLIDFSTRCNCTDCIRYQVVSYQKAYRLTLRCMVLEQLFFCILYGCCGQGDNNERHHKRDI